MNISSSEYLFVDTNILVYAHDSDAGGKRDVARDCLRKLWHRDRPPTVSVQVLQEFYVNLIRKNVPPQDVREVVSTYLVWHVVDNDRELLLEAMDERDRWQISLWDALILAAARRTDAQIIWSENFSAGQDYDGIRVVNPLRE